MNRYSLAIYTEEELVLESEVESIVAPGAGGYLGVWANHAPLLTALAPGKLEVRFARGEEKRYALAGGFLEVADNRAALLADAVEPADGIDEERARQARARAEGRLASPTPDTDVPRARAALARALNRLAVAREG